MGLSSKIIHILGLSYENTTNKIFYSNTFSESFNVDLGVKQGCILSPILFAMYLNDVLPGGVVVDNIHIKVILYAVDIVVLSDSFSQLQDMINVLFNYCQMWSLKVNMNKSKILVFRNGPRISHNLKWNFCEDSTDIGNSYKYLGIELTYNLSYWKHLKWQLSLPGLSI